MRFIEALCLYRHFKGGLYYVIGIAGDHETFDEFVVYHSIEGDCEMFIRPINDFLSEVPNGRENPTMQKYRFERIEKI
ncbi:DUF1653 domain-containing protein [Oceanobacillus timonensis]|uniref:DUF1653 domain-containing protein n=1 Tax=Oceanobacillus timonensis TaxID=1926285 RepID=UPI0009BC119E|nr:DUF1653 domain-containing protein [Oceanobacillus timonensis]